MSKNGRNGTRHQRAGGGARARSRKATPRKFRQGKPNRCFSIHPQRLLAA